MKKGILTIVTLLVIGLVAAGVFAFPLGGKERNSPTFNGFDAVQEAVHAGDYNAYVNAIKEIQPVDEESFNEHYQRMQERSGRRVEMQERNSEIRAALDKGDYDAWLSAVQETPRGEWMTQIINEDNFEKFVELHQAKQEKEWDKVQQLSEELGIEVPGFGGHHRRGMFGQGLCNQDE